MAEKKLHEFTELASDSAVFSSITDESSTNQFEILGSTKAGESYTTNLLKLSTIVNKISANLLTQIVTNAEALGIPVIKKIINYTNSKSYSFTAPGKSPVTYGTIEALAEANKEYAGLPCKIIQEQIIDSSRKNSETFLGTIEATEIKYVWSDDANDYIEIDPTYSVTIFTGTDMS